jgi:hypothetical protein
MMRFFVAVCLLAFAAPAAHAGGFNLTWGTGCWRENPATLHSFACDSNGGSASFTVSFAPDRNLDNFNSFYAVLNLQSDSPNMPDWWQLTHLGGCRDGALSTSAEFAAVPGGCADPWQGQIPSYSITWRTALFPGVGYGDIPAPNRAQFRVSYGTAPPLPLVIGAEYYGFRATINYQKTVGADACGGCRTPVILVLNEVTLVARVPNVLTGPLDNMCLHWQAAGATPCNATPVRNRTWGQLKSLYR